MAAKFGLDSTGMQCGCAQAASLQAAVESHCIEDVCGLGTAIRGEWLIRGPLEIRIVKIDIAYLMTSRGEDDDSRARLEKRHEPIHEYEVPEVIGSELRFEAILRLSLRRQIFICKHDPSSPH
jgi:hypothetical protein